MADPREMLRELRAEHARLVADAAPLRARRDDLRATIQPLEDQEREIITRIRAIEQPRLAELERSIRVLEKALGPDPEPSTGADG